MSSMFVYYPYTLTNNHTVDIVLEQNQTSGNINVIKVLFIKILTCFLFCNILGTCSEFTLQTIYYTVPLVWKHKATIYCLIIIYIYHVVSTWPWIVSASTKKDSYLIYNYQTSTFKSHIYWYRKDFWQISTKNKT